MDFNPIKHAGFGLNSKELLEMMTKNNSIWFCVKRDKRKSGIQQLTTYYTSC